MLLDSSTAIWLCLGIDPGCVAILGQLSQVGSAGEWAAAAGAVSIPPSPPQNSPLDLIDMGKGLKVQTEKPHLVSLGSGRLSTAITLLPLEEGECQGVSTGTLVTETLRCPLC